MNYARASFCDRASSSNSEQPEDLLSGKTKAHKHKLFSPVGLGTTPGLSRGFHRVCPWDKPGENLRQTRRRRDDNKNKIFAFEGGGGWGQRGKSSKNARFRGKRHDNRILKVQISLSRNFVVIAQAATNTGFLLILHSGSPANLGLSLGQTQFVPGTNPVCPRDIPGRRAGQKVYVKIVYVPFSLAI